MSDGRTEALRGTYFSDNKKMPTIDPQTGDLNPYLNLPPDPKDPFGNRFESHPSSADSKVIKKQQLPDARKHQIVSFAKSTVRIAGYILIPFNLESAAIVLILSEVIGIIEELV
tara:strand:- start:249 stop:590 length:342 start_codon:yes stop_codon:yes gene_type:complete